MNTEKSVMTFDEWKKLNKQQRKTIAATWNINKDEGREVAETVLKAFAELHSSNKSFEISDEIVRGNTGWGISVRCLDASILPKNFMGITVGWYHVDHIDDAGSRKILETLCHRSVLI